MAEKTTDGFDFDSSNLILFLYKWRKPLIIVSIMAALSAAFFSWSFFIPPKYKSTVILFPTSTASVSKSLLSKNAQTKQDLLEFGEEEQAEQMIQILNSDEIRSRVVKKYDLKRHYKIDSTSQYSETKLFKEYESNISFKRTEFMSVKIDVYDTDAQMAADIANDIAALLDTTKNRMQKERAFKAMKIAEAEYVEMRDYVKALEDSLNELRAMGINDYESQAERFTEYYAKSILEGKVAATKQLEEKIKILSQYGGAYVSIRDMLEYEKEQLSHLRAKYQEAKVDAEQILPHKFVVNNAFKAEKKSYPVRWLIVVVSTVSAFLLTILVIVAIENFNKIRN